MPDQFAGHVTALDSPATQAAGVTPNDSSDLAVIPRAVWVGVQGDLRVTMADGGTVTLANLTVGWHPIRTRRVFATGTTATNIVAVW